ncbi:MAG: PfkB family carbohydrate kinase [Chloroflexi bacterium]|nr:PfkB family carbohydrate kinase [Chloroflexota bacterium]
MRETAVLNPVDYLIIGHITQDLTSHGPVLGGSASYAALTAKAAGMRVGVVTSCRSDLDLGLFNGTAILRKESKNNSTFENIYSPSGRIQHIHAVAETLTLEDVPQIWRSSPLVHLGPVAHEISPDVASGFPNSFMGITPQGWLRQWDHAGTISFSTWPDAEKTLLHANAAVMSIEDVRNNEEIISEYAGYLPILVVTEGAAGARVYWNGDVRHFRPPQKMEVDPIGAGDVFAAAFFIRYQSTRDAWESARFATLLAANSVTRKTLSGIPTKEEINRFMTEILEQKTS